MKLYLISQNVNTGYDTYDSAVVCAGDPGAACMVHPDNSTPYWDGINSAYGGWCDAKDVDVEFIGIADRLQKAGVICASFNAG